MREWRERNGIKQSELARRAGVFQNLLSLLEAGKRNFTKDSSDKIYRAVKALEAERAARLTDIALNRDSRQVELENLHVLSKKELTRRVLTQAREISALLSEVQGFRQKAGQELSPLISKITDLMIERNIKPLTAKITELESQIADLRRLTGIETERLAKEVEAQDLREQIEQRVKKGE